MGLPPAACVHFPGAALGRPGPGCLATRVCPGAGIPVLICLSPCLGLCGTNPLLCCHGRGLKVPRVFDS